MLQRAQENMRKQLKHVDSCLQEQTNFTKFQELKVYATVPPPVELKSVLNQGFQDLEKFDSV